MARLSPKDIVVTILPADPIVDPVLEALALEATRAGICAIVGVWPPGLSYDGIHPTVAKYHTAQIPWDPDQLEGELGSDCVNAFLKPDGEEAELNEVDPHECD